MNFLRLIARFIWVSIHFILFTFDCALIYIRSVVQQKGKRWREDAVGRSLLLRLDNLSGAFTKFGQLLSTRPDIIPHAVATQLEGLLDNQSPASLKQNVETILLSTGCRSLDDIFASFDENPIAAGSFATVYRARLRAEQADGSERLVAVKVQRPGLQNIVRSDLVIIRFFSAVVDATTLLGRFRMKEVAHDFALWTKEELDYELEARRMHWLRGLHSDEDFIIPEIFWDYTSKTLLIMQFFEGVWASEIGDRENTGLDDKKKWFDENVDREAVASKLMQGLLKEIFEFGIFHADPHPGNICFLGGDKVGVIDFGIIGTINSRIRDNQLQLLSAIETEDLELAWSAIRKLLFIPPDAQIKHFQMSFERNVRDWVMMQSQPNIQPEEKSAAVLLLANFRAARESGMSFEPDAVRYYRSFMILDHVVTKVAPEMSIIDSFREYLKHRFHRRKLNVAESIAEDNGLWLKMRLLDSVSLIPRALNRFEALLSEAEDYVIGVYSKPMAYFSSFLMILGPGLMWLGALILFLVLVGVPIDLGFLLGIAGPPYEIFGFSINFTRIGLGCIVCGAIAWWLGKLLWVRSYKLTK